MWTNHTHVHIRTFVRTRPEGQRWCWLTSCAYTLQTNISFTDPTPNSTLLTSNNLIRSRTVLDCPVGLPFPAPGRTPPWWDISRRSKASQSGLSVRGHSATPRTIAIHSRSRSVPKSGSVEIRCSFFYVCLSDSSCKIGSQGRQTKSHCCYRDARRIIVSWVGEWELSFQLAQTTAQNNTNAHINSWIYNKPTTDIRARLDILFP